MTVTPVKNAVELTSFSTKDGSEIELIKSLVERMGAPLMILDCDVVRNQYRALQAALPNVTTILKPPWSTAAQPLWSITSMNLKSLSRTQIKPKF